MKCQKCGNNNANVNYTRIINGKRQDLHLCSDCAEKLNINFDFDFSFNNMISDFFNDFSRMRSFAIPDLVGFRSLGSGIEDFVNDGFFSNMPFISNNYLIEHEENSLDDALNSIQKKYRKAKKEDEAKESKSNALSNCENVENKKAKLNIFKKDGQKQSEIEQLKAKLQEYIKNEEYEKAAVVRDEIKKLEK